MSAVTKTTEELITEALLETPEIKEKVNENELNSLRNVSVGELSLSENPYLRTLSILVTGITDGKSDKAIYDQICISLRSLARQACN